MYISELVIVSSLLLRRGSVFSPELYVNCILIVLILLNLYYISETSFPISEVYLKLTMWLRMTLCSWFPCLHLLRAGITSVHKCVPLVLILNLCYLYGMTDLTQTHNSADWHYSNLPIEMEISHSSTSFHLFFVNYKFTIYHLCYYLVYM